ncbi:TOPRIM nucleotidyl transferase/hydrolase domain-containing protein [Streptomyces sviceus]|uniref:TOPRIM nucleotidyl transferase/hydrolase domain-containing protein n=1 Tax=Streptomyces sviceus TaxID=285530 RepID=UPI003326AAD3
MRHPDRCPDATKSALLFASRVILVEGISELLLLPVLAERVLAGDEGADAPTKGGVRSGRRSRRWMVLRATPVIVGGLWFEVEQGVLPAPVEGIALITDTDVGPGGRREMRRPGARCLAPHPCLI